jgi:hypothetical protein
MASTDDYIALVTSEHRGKALFEAAVRAFVQGFVDNNNAVFGMLAAYDLDTAVGDQLDTIALWVGVVRRVPVPITNVYLTWSGTVQTGWGQGVWKGPFDPGTGLVSLGDADLRLLIRAKIAANMWDGTSEQLDAILEILFGPTAVKHYDLQDGTYRITYSQSALSGVQQALLINNFLLLKPAGVGIVYVAAP